MNSSLPKQPPRFLPTLTEVVQPQEVGSVLAAGTVPATAAVPADDDLLVQRVAARVEALLAARLRQLIGGVLQEQAQLLQPRLQQELTPWVQQAVADAIAQESQRVR